MVIKHKNAVEAIYEIRSHDESETGPALAPLVTLIYSIPHRPRGVAAGNIGRPSSATVPSSPAWR